MNVFKNIYIILLSIIMPFILKINDTPYGKAIIAYGVLAGISYLYTWSKSLKTDPVLEELNKKLDSTDEYLEAGKGIMEIAKILKEESNIPEIFTIKSIIHPVKEAVIEEILPHTARSKAPSDTGVIKLLDSMLTDFDYNKVKTGKEELETLDELKNIFYLKENVTFTITKEGDEPEKGFGTLIFTLNGILFSPQKFELFKNINKKNLIDLAHKTSASMPFLNVGVSTVALLSSFSDANSEKQYLTGEKKKEISENYESNNGWYLPYLQIDRFTYPSKMKGLRAVSPSIILTQRQNKYELFHADEKYDFKDELLEQLLFVNVLNRQIFYPYEDKNELRMEKCELVPHTEIDYSELKPEEKY